jgi:hypothetical protein
MPSTLPPDTPTSSGDDPAGAVEVRIRNASDVDFIDVYAVFPGGEKVHYGPVPAGGSSAYEPVKQAYSYSYLKVTAAKSYVYQPIDYVGESLLEPGQHTYVLSLVGGELDLKLE